MNYKIQLIRFFSSINSPPGPLSLSILCCISSAMVHAFFSVTFDHSYKIQIHPLTWLQFLLQELLARDEMAPTWLLRHQLVLHQYSCWYALLHCSQNLFCPYVTSPFCLIHVVYIIPWIEISTPNYWHQYCQIYKHLHFIPLKAMWIYKQLTNSFKLSNIKFGIWSSIRLHVGSIV